MYDDQENAVSIAAQASFVVLTDIDLAVDLECRLGDEEKTASDQDDIAPGKLVVENNKDGIAQLPEANKSEQQSNAENKR